ncbi:unnamed protein product [Rangifer tarandus platyrhynchus]|uniref:Uncharacterized protein n=2 Tax=Rangifer tarandus platyrhynchus TaxID=3082113 RepID=A0ABN8ZW99_RANTA|nr:unnamed protein product [Rangifer tarandus platyrhynchus]
MMLSGCTHSSLPRVQIAGPLDAGASPLLGTEDVVCDMGRNWWRGRLDLQEEEQAGCQQTAVRCPISRDVGAQLTWLQATLIIPSLSLAPRSTVWLWSESQLHCDPP